MHRISHTISKGTVIPVYLLIVVATAILLSLINFPYGFGADGDAARVIEHARRLLDEGYQPSRSWGFPMYELVIYPIIFCIGVFYAKLYSLVFYAAGSALFLLTLQKLTSDPLKSLIGTLCFVALPVSIISGNTVMDTSQGMFFALLGLYSYIRFSRDRSSFYFYLMAAALGLAVSTRPDYVILSSAIGLTTLLFYWEEPKKKFALGALIWSVFAFLPFFIYGQYTLHSGVFTTDSLLHRLTRALVGYVALLGIPTVALLTFLVLKNYKNWFGSAKRIVGDDLLFLFLVVLVLYSVRWVMVPNELEYVYILVPLLIVVAIRLNIRQSFLLLLLIAIAVPNVIQLHLFTRDQQGNAAFGPGISSGAIAQDRSARLQTKYQWGELPEQLDRIAREHGYNEYAGSPQGEPSDRLNDLVILPTQSLHNYQPDVRRGFFHRVACTQTIIAYPMPASKGWRQLMEPFRWHIPEPQDFKEVTLPYCE